MLAVILYMDRVCVSAAKDAIAKDLDLTDPQMGWVLSAFALGYALLQTPSGIMADRLGPRKMLFFIVTLWSTLTAVTSFAWNYISMITIRFLFGAGEAGAFPGMSRVVYNWIPQKERGLVTGINFSGSRLGAAFALPVIAWMIQSYGWKETFIKLGILGIVWAVIWIIIFRDGPEEHPMLSQKEKDYILEHRTPRATTVAKEKVPLSKLFSSTNIVLLMIQYFCSNFTFFFALTWLFPYVKKQYTLDSVAAGWLAAVPLVAGAMGNWFAGWLTDYLYQRGQLRQSRIIPASIGFGLAAIGLILSIYAQSATTAIAFLSIALFGADMTLPPSWAVCVDTGRQHSGAVSGTMNMAGNLGAFLTSLAFPYLQALTGSTSTFFIVGGVLNLIAVFVWQKIQSEKYFEEY